MMSREEVIRHAKMTLAAEKNLYGSVEKVFSLALDALGQENAVGYLGIKDTPSIPLSAVEALAKAGYVLHTLDKAVLGGRAVDLQLRNPITGRPMTGSSSGTAMNVRLYFNDLGLGTDGGGSVLAPAMSVNLFGFISPLICAKERKRYGRFSTDGHFFYPSLGLIARSWDELCHGLAVLPGMENVRFHAETGRTLLYRLTEEGLFNERGDLLRAAPRPMGRARTADCFFERNAAVMRRSCQRGGSGGS